MRARTSRRASVPALPRGESVTDDHLAWMDGLVRDYLAAANASQRTWWGDVLSDFCDELIPLVRSLQEENSRLKQTESIARGLMDWRKYGCAGDAHRLLRDLPDRWRMTACGLSPRIQAVFELCAEQLEAELGRSIGSGGDAGVDRRPPGKK